MGNDISAPTPSPRTVVAAHAHAPSQSHGTRRARATQPPPPPSVPWGDRDAMLLRDMGTTLVPHSPGWPLPCSPRPQPGMHGAGSAAGSLAPTPPWPRSLAPATLPQGCGGQSQTPISAEGSWATTSGQSPPCPGQRRGCAAPPPTAVPLGHLRKIRLSSKTTLIITSSLIAENN